MRRRSGRNRVRTYRLLVLPFAVSRSVFRLRGIAARLAFVRFHSCA